MVLFANYKTWSVAVDDKGKKRKAQGGERVMYTSHNPCWDAKNRYGLPDEVPFSYESIRHIIEQEGGRNTYTGRQKPTQGQPAPDPAPRPETPDMKTGKQMTMHLEEGTDGQPDPDRNTEVPAVDPRVPKKLRDLMIANQVDEWDIQGVVESRGYFPGDLPVWEYPADFVEGCLVAAWDQVYEMIREMKERDAVVFN